MPGQLSGTLAGLTGTAAAPLSNSAVEGLCLSLAAIARANNWAPRTLCRCSNKIRRTSCTARGWWWTSAWKAGTITSDAAPSTSGAPIRHHAIATVFALANDRTHDGVILHVGRDGPLGEQFQSGRTGRQQIDTRRQLREILLGCQPGVFAQHVPGSGQQFFRQLHQARQQLRRQRRSQCGAVMRRRQEHDALDAGLLLEVKDLLQLLAGRWLGFEVREGLLANQVPEVVAAVLRQQLADQPAHAVADEDHLIEGRILVLGIDVAAQLCDDAANRQRKRGTDRRSDTDRTRIGNARAISDRPASR